MAVSKNNFKSWPSSFRIYLDDKDVTPLPLVLETTNDENEQQPQLKEETPKPCGISAEEQVLSESTSSESDTSSSSCFRYSLTSPISLECMELPFTDADIEKFRERIRTPSPVEEVPLKISQARIDELMKEEPLFSDKIILSLKETPTFFLLERQSLTELEGTPEAENIKKENEHYDYLTIGEGRRRYTKNAETQTKFTVWKSKDVWAPAADVIDDTAEASTYDLYQSLKDNVPS